MLDRVLKLALRVVADTADGQSALERLGGAAGKLGQALTSAEREFKQGFASIRREADATADQLSRLRNMVAGAFAADKLVDFARQAIGVKDAMLQMDAGLKLALGGNGSAVAAVRADLAGIAQGWQVAIGEVAGGFGKMATSVTELGGTTSQAVRMTEALALSAKVSGASVQQANAAMQQFGQSMQSGRLNGDELQSVLENNGRLARALADGLKVPVGALKDLGEQSKLTSDVIARSLLSQLEKLRDEAATMPQTFGGAIVQVSNAFALWIGASQDATTAQGALVAALQTIALHMNELMGVALGLAGALAVLAAARLTAFLVQLAAGFAGAAAQAGVATVAVRGLGAATALVGGPVGVLVAGLAGLAMWLLKSGDAATEAAAKYEAAGNKLRHLKLEGASATKVFAQELEVRKADIDRKLQERFGSVNPDAGEYKGNALARRELQSLLQARSQVEQEISNAKRSALLASERAQPEVDPDLGVKQRAQRAQADLKKLREGLRTDREKMADEVAEIRRLGKEAGESPEKIAADVARVTEKYEKKGAKGGSILARALGIEKSDMDALRASLDRELDAIKSRLEVAGADLERANQANLVSIKDYYDRRLKIVDDGLAAEVQRNAALAGKLAQEVERLRVLKPKTDDERARVAKEIQRIESQVADLNARNLDLEQKRATAKKDASQASAQARDALLGEVQDTELAALQRRGTAGSAVDRERELQLIKAQQERRYKPLIEKADNNAGDPLFAGAGDMLRQARDASVAMEQLAALQSRAARLDAERRAAVEDITRAQQAGAKGEYQARQEVITVTETYRQQLGELMPQMRDLAQVVGGDQPDAVMRLGKSLEYLPKQVDLLGESLKMLEDRAPTMLADMFTALATNSGKASDVVKRSVNAMIGDIMRLASRDLIGAGKALFSGASGGSSSGSSGSSSFFADAFKMIGSFFHSGGIVGAGATRTAAMPSWLWAGAPRFHSGGILKPGEVPIIGKVGEEMLTEDDPRHTKNGGGAGKLTVNIFESPGGGGRVEKSADGMSVDVWIEKFDSGLATRVQKGVGAMASVLDRAGLRPAMAG